MNAALQNITPVWKNILDRLGLNIVVVTFNTKALSLIGSHPELEISLGLELQEVGAGFYDSSFYPGCYNEQQSGNVWHFFHCHDLGKAMQRLKNQIEVRGLLFICTILHVEEFNQLRVWYSYDPEAIGKLVEG